MNILPLIYKDLDTYSFSPQIIIESLWVQMELVLRHRREKNRHSPVVSGGQYLWMSGCLAFLGAQWVKNLPANAGKAGDLGLISGSLREETATQSSILACRIHKEKGTWGLPSMGLQRIRHN